MFDKRIAEKLYKPKRKDTMLDCMRHCVSTMEKWRHPKMLQIIHALEEGTTTLAFASEPVLASLANILAWHVSILNNLILLYITYLKVIDWTFTSHTLFSADIINLFVFHTIIILPRWSTRDILNFL